ncbi:MAG: metallopeptidase family protein [Micropruina sp.]|uniref:metallopeptidase family protein n=1 Tax=Micropruina sp. TaxID=2737536 RepID=UPI0039E6D5A3
MAHRRERHGRGLRGPLALPNPLTGDPVPLRGRPQRAEYFTACVRQAVGRVTASCPRALVGIDVGVEDVPTTVGGWSRDRVPLAAAIGPEPPHTGQVVLYRRPLEHRARTRKGLRILVFRTLVEQLHALTEIPMEELDPEGWATDDDWE